MTVLFHKGLGYSSLNSARSALSTFISIDGQSVGSHPLMRRFMKGVFNLRPALPRNEVTWDTNVVLHYLRSLSPVKNLDLKQLTYKLAMLLTLLTGQRCQTVHAVNIHDMTLTDNHIKIRIKTLLKQSRPGHHLAELKIKGYAPDRRICLITVMKEYLVRTSSFRKSQQLFLSYVNPHGPVSKDTVARWVKTVMALSGIDTGIFAAHSTRAAATSNAKMNNVPLSTIMKTAGWSSAGTFATYYDKLSPQGKDFATALQDKSFK